MSRFVVFSGHYSSFWWHCSKLLHTWHECKLTQQHLDLRSSELLASCPTTQLDRVRSVFQLYFVFCYFFCIFFCFAFFYCISFSYFCIVFMFCIFVPVIFCIVLLYLYFIIRFLIFIFYFSTSVRIFSLLSHIFISYLIFLSYCIFISMFYIYILYFCISPVFILFYYQTGCDIRRNTI